MKRLFSDDAVEDVLGPPALAAIVLATIAITGALIYVALHF
jgi:hypothetical protein